jgi:putative transposase
VSDETITRVYRYRLYPTRRQIEALTSQLAFACDLYNAALEQRRTAYRDHGVAVRFSDQQHDLTEVRHALPFPDGMNYNSQELVLKQLDLAFIAFFRRVRKGEAPGFPRFKPKQRFNTLGWRNAKGGAAIVNDRLRIQGVGHIKVKWHRELPGEVRQTRITRRNGRWYVAFAVRMEKPAPLPATGQEVGVDLGVRQFATLSNDTFIASPRPAWTAAASIAKSRRKVTRRQRGSHRRRKAVAELARRKEREANRRRDAAHKAARFLVDRFDLIAVEDLHPPEMVKGGRWLAREISDQGWSQFLKCLEDKAESAGRRVVRVNPKNTSRRCFACGHVDPASRKGPLYLCTTCGHTDDADANAGKNILHRARTEPSGVVAAVPALPEKPPSGVVTAFLPTQPISDYKSGEGNG